MKINLFFIRHANSCANIIKSNSNNLDYIYFKSTKENNKIKISELGKYETNIASKDYNNYLKENKLKINMLLHTARLRTVQTLNIVKDNLETNKNLNLLKKPTKKNIDLVDIIPNNKNSQLSISLRNTLNIYKYDIDNFYHMICETINEYSKVNKLNNFKELNIIFFTHKGFINDLHLNINKKSEISENNNLYLQKIYLNNLGNHTYNIKRKSKISKILNFNNIFSKVRKNEDNLVKKSLSICS